MCWVLKEQTHAPGATEAASSCASTWAAVAGPAPAPTVTWPRMALPASATRVICSTLRGPYWKAFTFQMKVTSIHPSSRLKIRLFSRVPLPWPLTTARQQPGPTASFTATPTLETSRWLMTTGRGDLLLWKVCLRFYCALLRCTSCFITFKVHLNSCSILKCATILGSARQGLRSEKNIITAGCQFNSLFFSPFNPTKWFCCCWVTTICLLIGPNCLQLNITVGFAKVKLYWNHTWCRMNLVSLLVSFLSYPV